MPKARQQYFADEIAINKEARTFTFDDEILDKIDNIDGRAEENVIEIVKVNSVPLPVDAQKAVDVTVPWVVDSLSSTSTTSSLSANQWKILYDYIVNLQSRGRFLSSWNAQTWTPVTTPFWSGYNYNPWDYYVVTVIDSTTNYRPDWPTYVTGQVSTVVETETVDLGDMYIYDGSQWLFQKNTARQIAIDPTLSTSSTNPVENRVVTNAINTKQNLLTAWANIQIVSDVISATDTTYPNLPADENWVDNTLVTTGDKYNWNQKQDGLTAWANIQINGNVISATDTVYGNLSEAQGWNDVTLVTTWDKYNWNHKQDWLTAWANITISWWVISATDTTYNNLPAAQGGTDVTLVTTWDKYNWNNKQDSLTAWANITINWWVISAIDTTYNNLPAAQWGTDNTLVTTWDKYNWNNKQDKLTAWANITINNWLISATDTTYTAWDWISIYGNVISNTKTFDPGAWSTWQVLTKTSNWYRRANGSSAVTSVNGMTWDVTVSEFLPGSWSTGQVLKKTSSGYGWANESWWWGGGWGWGNYYGWNWINVTSNYEIINTKPFDPAQWGSVWQVLTKTSSGYEWASVSWGAANVKCFELNPSNYTQEEIWEIIGWVNRGASYWAIIKLPSTGDVCVYSRVMSSNGGLVYEFPWILYFTDWNNDGNGDYTTLYNHELKITRANNTYTVEFGNFNGIANFLKVSNSWYQVPYMPTEDYQPATKAYVDSVAGGWGWWGNAITSNTTWTNIRVTQERAGTQAQYNALVANNQIQQWVIYNITN